MMLEFLLTSFPVVIRYYMLKRRGEAMTVSNMKFAVLLWLMMAFGLFVAIFYYHPNSYTGIVPFRTVSVVAQSNGPVTELPVKNGQHVRKGDLLFKIEDATQVAALARAKAAFANLDANEAKARDGIKIAEANVSKAASALIFLEEELANAETLLAKKIGRADTVRRKMTSLQNGKATLAAAQAQLDSAKTELSKVLPAARKSAEADLEFARVALEKTEVRAFSDGIVTQLALSVGSPATQLIVSPSMVIVPDRSEDAPNRLVAGYSQVAKGVLYEGMPVEVACASNLNISMKNSIMPGRVIAIQPAIAAGQITPSGNLIELDTRAKRGTLLVYLELLHKEHQAMLINGSGCLVQNYTDNLSGIVGHVIVATGIIKAFLLRVKTWGVLIIGVGLAGTGH